MTRGVFFKLLQRQTYTCLSHQYGIYFAFTGIVLVLYSMFQFGEELLEWSQSQYDSMFSLYHDNIVGKSFQAMMAAPIPIDVVYTWVNGSDPVLLNQLTTLKRSLNSGVISTNSTTNPTLSFPQCTHRDCFLLPCLVTYPSLGEHETVESVKEKFDGFSHLKWTKQVHVYKGFISETRGNASLLRFETKEKLSEALSSVQQLNRTFSPVYITTANFIQKSSPALNALVLKGIPDKMNSDELKEKLPINIKEITEWIYVAEAQNLALVWTSDSVKASKILDPKDNSSLSFFGIDSSNVKIYAAYMIAHVDEEPQDDMARSRFEDNEELRYSLRSVEKYAPWVRKIFIVTNGQIPYWLNMDNPRIHIVTHDDIFLNKSHLPTFSSPAIESHIHRIPGLAKKFIYMNDDVMFGREVWPDDFYTHSFGQKVYLTWPVPNCADGCAPSWIKDGFCDTACNVSDCSWDGGDCIGDNVRPGVGAGPHGGYSFTPSSYCFTGCADAWLSDKFCDQSCNKVECGFDAGDCGTGNYEQLYKIKFKLINGSVYNIPPGIKNAYIDTSKHFRKISSANYEKDKAIRTAAVSNKYNVTTFVYRANGNISNIQVKLTGFPKSSPNAKGDIGNETELTVVFNITAEPSRNVTQNLTELNRSDPEEYKVVVGETLKNVSKNESKAAPEDFLEIISFPENIKRPHVLPTKGKRYVTFATRLPQYIDVKILPENVQQTLKSLDKEFENEIWTKQGYEKRKYDLLLPYLDALKAVQSGKNLTEKATSEFKPDKFKMRKDSVAKIAQEKTKDDRKTENGQISDANPDVTDLSEQGHLHKKGDPGEIEQQKKNSKPPQLLRKEVDNTKAESMRKNPFYRIVKNLNYLKKDTGNVTADNHTVGENFRTRKLLWVMEENATTETLERILHNQPKKSSENAGFLPWEQNGIFDIDVKNLEEMEERKRVLIQYQVESRKGRKTLDTFADSLRYVSNIYNKDFGFTQRKVPAHMPHFIDRDVMYELQGKYPQQYDITSSHKLRHSQDMQFAFSYFYYLMSVTEPVNISNVFNSLDTDDSRVLSDRELRMLATRTHTLPLTLQELTDMEKNIISCAKTLYGPEKINNETEIDMKDLHQPTEGLESWAVMEHYYDKDMPLVTQHLVINCPLMVDLINKSYTAEKKYKHQVMDEEEVTFKMIRNNVSTVVGQLDDIRRNPKKFICLNDNIDHHNAKDAEMVKAVLRDFYETFFPKESQFELPIDYRNRFLDIYSLRAWKEHRDYVAWWLRVALIILLFFTILSIVWDKVSNSWRVRKNMFLRKVSGFIPFSSRPKRKRKPSNV